MGATDDDGQSADGIEPIMKAQMEVSRCLPSTTSMFPACEVAPGQGGCRASSRRAAGRAGVRCLSLVEKHGGDGNVEQQRLHEAGSGASGPHVLALVAGAQIHLACEAERQMHTQLRRAGDSAKKAPLLTLPRLILSIMLFTCPVVNCRVTGSEAKDTWTAAAWRAIICAP